MTKTTMRERARRKAARAADRKAKGESLMAWLQERQTARQEAKVQAAREAAQEPKSTRGVGRVPARYRTPALAPVVLVEARPNRYRGIAANRATRRAMGQRGRGIGR